MNPDPFEQPIMIELGGAFSYVHVRITPARDPKGTLICLHDMVGSGADFSPLAGRLAAQGWTVVAPDFPGRGLSTVLPETLYTIRTYVDVMAAILRAHGTERTMLLGNGWGAMIALAAENVWAGRLARLILCDLPFEWSFASDLRAQIWQRLALQSTSDEMELRHQIKVIADQHGPVGASILSTALGRISDRAGIFSLAIDPALFNIFLRNPDIEYSTVPMLRACRTETLALTSMSGLLRRRAVAPLALRSGGSLTEARVACERFTDWSDIATALPVLGAILA
jgi:pimeloyl-ACP methyl ester carboxylesterase